MKLPKHRANVYVVERRVLDISGIVSYAVVGVFPTVEGADHFKGACEQEFHDRGFSDDDFTFNVVLSTYYDA
jgi:hypothetical protein